MKIKTKDIVYQNEYLKLVWQDTRLVILDTDGNYFDYVFDIGSYDERKQQEMVDDVIDIIKIAGNDNEFVDTLKDLCCDNVLKVEKYCGDKNNMKCLREQWGDEYVNRFGSHAIIVKE